MNLLANAIAKNNSAYARVCADIYPVVNKEYIKERLQELEKTSKHLKNRDFVLKVLLTLTVVNLNLKSNSGDLGLIESLVFEFPQLSVIFKDAIESPNYDQIFKEVMESYKDTTVKEVFVDSVLLLSVFEDLLKLYGVISGPEEKLWRKPDKEDQYGPN